MVTPERCRLNVVTHPLVQHKLTLLRDKDTHSGEFRRLCREITLLAAYEALADLPLVDTMVDTPLTTAPAKCLAGSAPAVIGILRAGLVMVDAILELLPQSPVGHLGMYRDPETHLPVDYYAKLPDSMEQREVIVVDPMLATGGSAVHAIDVVRAAGSTNIALLSIIGCPEGVAAVHAAHPDVVITVAGLDERLNEHAYIVPGLGDAGDRLYGTR